MRDQKSESEPRGEHATVPTTTPKVGVKGKINENEEEGEPTRLQGFLIVGFNISAVLEATRKKVRKERSSPPVAIGKRIWQREDGRESHREGKA